jgi:hypothetical protein
MTEQLTELLPGNINNRDKHGETEKAVMAALRAHDWKTSMEMAFGYMTGPVISRNGHIIDARTRKPDGGCSPQAIIAFFEDYLRKAEAAGATYFGIYLYKIMGGSGLIRYGLHVKYPNH